MKCFMRTTIYTIIAGLLAVGLIFFFLSVCPQPVCDASYQHTGKNPEAKRILILTTRGGGGNISASRAMTEYLESEYAVASASVFEDVLGQLDPTGSVTGGRLGWAIEMYDYILCKKWYWVTAAMSHLGSWYFSFRRSAVEAAFEDYFRQNNPDMVISVTPYVNSMILDAAQKFNIPFLLVPTDLVTTTFLDGIKRPTYDKFHLALAFDEEMLTCISDPAQINPDHIHITGFPVRKQFFMSPDQYSGARIKARTELGIPEKKPTVLLLMGALGSQELPTFVKWLSQVRMPLHIIAAIGKNEKLRKPLSQMILPEHISLSVIGFTSNMAQLMSAADLLLTKSGTVSVCEGIYMNLPMLLDGTTRVPLWERVNHNFVEAQGLGVSIKQFYDIPRLVSAMFAGGGKRLDRYKANAVAFKKKDPVVEIPKLVKQLLS